MRRFRFARSRRTSSSPHSPISEFPAFTETLASADFRFPRIRRFPTSRICRTFRIRRFPISPYPPNSPHPPTKLRRNSTRPHAARLCWSPFTVPRRFDFATERPHRPLPLSHRRRPAPLRNTIERSDGVTRGRMLFFADPEEWANLRCDVVRYTPCWLSSSQTRPTQTRAMGCSRGTRKYVSSCNCVCLLTCCLAPARVVNERQRARARAPQSDRLVGLPLKTKRSAALLFASPSDNWSVYPQKQTKKRNATLLFFFMCAVLRHRLIDSSIIYPQKTVFFSCLVIRLVELCGGGMVTMLLERGGGDADTAAAAAAG